MKIRNTAAHRFVVSRLLWATGLSPILTIPANGYRLRFYPTAISAAMWCDPRYYERDEAALKCLLRPGDNFVDVGANVDVLTLAGSTLVGSQGRVFSIEAHPKIAKYLDANVKLNRAEHVQVIHAAVGDRNGEAHLSDRRSDDQNAISADGLTVPLRTLDSLLPDIPIRVLKIDVEGFELFVLNGAQRVLQRTDYVYFESWERHFVKFGYGTREVIRFLKDRGFCIGRDEGHVSHECENLLAVKDGAQA